MDIALAIVDILAGNQHPSAQKNRTNWKCWKCGLTAGKERNYVKTDVSSAAVSALQAAEDEEYLEYLEERYAGYILAEEIEETE